MIDRGIKVVYTESTMKSLRKTAASSLILTLAFFAGSFCLQPMSAQAMEASPSMVMFTSTVSGNTVSGHDNSATTWNLCVVNCASQPAQAVAAKKFSIDSGVNFLTDVSYAQTFHLPVLSLGATDISGTHPPAPDILSSIFKKE